MDRRSLAALILTVLISPAATAANESQDAKAILARVTQAYQSLKSYSFEGKSISETTIAGRTSKSEVGFVVAYAAPNKMRLEFRYPTAGNWVRVSDGEFMLVTRTLTKESRRAPVTDRTMQTLNSSPLYAFQNLSESAQNPRLMPSEAIEVGLRHIDCDVVRFAVHPMALRPNESAGTSTIWVDKESGIVLKEEIRTSGGTGDENGGSRRIIQVESFQLNGDLTADLFSTHPHHGEGAFNRK